MFDAWVAFGRRGSGCKVRERAAAAKRSTILTLEPLVEEGEGFRFQLIITLGSFITSTPVVELSLLNLNSRPFALGMSSPILDQLTGVHVHCPPCPRPPWGGRTRPCGSDRVFWPKNGNYARTQVQGVNETVISNFFFFMATIIFCGNIMQISTVTTHCTDSSTLQNPTLPSNLQIQTLPRKSMVFRPQQRLEIIEKRIWIQLQQNWKAPPDLHYIKYSWTCLRFNSSLHKSQHCNHLRKHYFRWLTSPCKVIAQTFLCKTLPCTHTQTKCSRYRCRPCWNIATTFTQPPLVA